MGSVWFPVHGAFLFDKKWIIVLLDWVLLILNLTVIACGHVPRQRFGTVFSVYISSIALNQSWLSQRNDILSSVIGVQMNCKLEL